MSQSQEVPIVILDVDPQDHPDYHAPELPLDDVVSDQYQSDDPRTIVSQEIQRPRHPRAEKPKVGMFTKAKRVGAVALFAMGSYGAYSIYQGIFSGGGSKFEAKASVEETRVYLYENTPLHLAEIQSDIDLEMTAGYDRTVKVGPFEADLNPINNEYYLKQKGLTTETTAILTVAKMQVEESPKEIVVTLSGGMNISEASIDWRSQEFAGADIKGRDFSFGNELKDRIDNDALEILQTSGEVAAACALRGEEVQLALTDGVANFLKIVNPALFKKDKPLTVIIEDLESEADRIYSESVDSINDVVDDISSDYSGKDDTFSVDITGILDCRRQDVRVIKESK